MSATTLIDLSVCDHERTRLVAVAGEVDISSVAPVRAAVAEALAGGVETLVLDLAGVSFMDSSGIHLLLEATARSAQAGVRFVALPGPAHVQQLFELTGVARDVPFARSSGTAAG